ncbi:MAG TPA: serine hydrolase domain-containing protein [Chloroflexota bacterium]|nr:serine hydrolase domain-containing protein [Chloroflexota bacterium]
MSVAGLTVEGLVDVEGADEAGLDAEALRRAFDLLASWVKADVLPGAAALVARGGKVAGEAYLGLAHRAQQRAVGPETIWSLASVTKPFTAGAVMLLVEEGRLSLDEPLYRMLPEFLDGAASAFDRKAVTLRHVLSHCSGLPGFSPDNTALRQAHRPLEDFVRSFGAQPLLFAPGSAHYYSNPGILLAAETVGRALAGTLGERVPGPAVSRYHPFVHERILAPLGMESSSLLPPPEWDERIAWVERTGTEGMDWEGANSRYYRTLGIPWGGLYSRPRELVRYVDLFLPLAGGRQRVGTGAAEGVQLVSPATAQAMTAVQFDPPDAPSELAPELRDAAARTPPLTAVEWGLGWTVKGTKRPHFSGELTSALTYGHLGATGTMVWADPAQDVACVLLTNRTLVSGWTQERPRQALFSNAVMAALR